MSEHDERIKILEARIRHTDIELAQARFSIESCKEKRERDLKEMRHVRDKFLSEHGMMEDFNKWYSEKFA